MCVNGLVLGGVSQGVLHAADGILHLAGGLVGGAFGLQLGVAGHLPAASLMAPLAWLAEPSILSLSMKQLQIGFTLG